MAFPLSPSCLVPAGYSFFLLFPCLTSLHPASSLRLSPLPLLPQPATPQLGVAAIPTPPLAAQHLALASGGPYGLPHVSDSGTGKLKGENTPLKQGHISASSRHFRFSAKPGGSYCILSHPCIHVNAIVAEVPANATETWVDSVVVKSGQSTLLLSALGQGSVTSPGIAITVDGESTQDMVIDQMVVNGKHGELSVNLWKSRVGMLYFMITAHTCNVRLLLSVPKPGAGVAKAPSNQPRAGGAALSIEVLDWARLRQATGMFPTGFMSSDGGDMFLEAKRSSGDRGGAATVFVAGSSEFFTSTPDAVDCKCSRFARQDELRKNM